MDRAQARTLLIEEKFQLELELKGLQAIKTARQGQSRKSLFDLLIKECQRSIGLVEAEKLIPRIEKILDLLQKLIKQPSAQEVDERIKALENQIKAFEAVIAYLEEEPPPVQVPDLPKKTPKKKRGKVVKISKPVKAQTDKSLPPESGQEPVTPKWGKPGVPIAHGRKLEILRAIVERHLKNGQASAAKVMADFKKEVKPPKGFGRNHLRSYLYKIGYTCKGKKIKPFQPSENKGKRPKRNYRDKALAIFLHLGLDNQHNRIKITAKGKELKLISSDQEAEALMCFMHKHAQDTLEKNRLFKLISLSRGKKRSGGTFELTALGKRIVKKHKPALLKLGQ